jgi:hypothetical protein
MSTFALCHPEASQTTIMADALPRFSRTPVLMNRARSLELDMIRGMALFVMLSDHLLGNPLALLTSRPLGHFSGADLFVFVSGIAAGLKYQRSYATGGMAKVGSGVVWSWIILLMTCSILRAWSNLSGILYMYVVFWGLIGVLAPVCTRGWWKGVVAVSVLGWLAAFWVPLPAPFTRWVFNPLSWQLLFSVGFLFGHRKASGAGPLPRRETLLRLAAAIAVVCFVLRHSSLDTTGWLYSGSRVGPLRLLDFLAVAYLCYHLVRVPERVAKLFASLGRLGLWVFVWVTVLVAAWEFAKLPSGPFFLRMTAATAALSSLWLVIPMAKAIKDQVRRVRQKWGRVVAMEPAEATV